MSLTDKQAKAIADSTGLNGVMWNIKDSNFTIRVFRDIYQGEDSDKILKHISLGSTLTIRYPGPPEFKATYNPLLNNAYDLFVAIHSYYKERPIELNKLGTKIIFGSFYGHDGRLTLKDYVNLLLDSFKYGFFDIIDFLSRSGIDVRPYFNQGLREAVEGKNLDMVRYLIQNGANEHRTNLGIIASAVSNDDIPLTRYLIEQGAIYTNVISLARHYGYTDMINYLQSLPR